MAQTALIAVFGGVMIVLRGRIVVMLGVGAMLAMHCVRRGGRVAGRALSRRGKRLLANDHSRGCARIKREPQHQQD